MDMPLDKERIIAHARQYERGRKMIIISPLVLFVVGVLIAVAISCFGYQPPPAIKGPVVGAGPGFAPMQRGSLAVPEPDPLRPDGVFAIYDAANYVDGGVGQPATLTEPINGLHLNNFMAGSYYETVKPTQGADAFGTYLMTDGGDVLVRDFTGSGTYYPNASMTMIAVFLPTVAANMKCMFSVNSVDHRDMHFSNYDDARIGVTGAGGTYLNGNTNYSTATPTIATYHWGNGTVVTRVNGSTFSTTTDAGINGWGGTASEVRWISVLAEAFPQPSGAHFYGAINGTKIYYWTWIAGIATETTIAVEQALAAKYGVTIP